MNPKKLILLELMMELGGSPRGGGGSPLREGGGSPLRGGGPGQVRLGCCVASERCRNPSATHTER